MLRLMRAAVQRLLPWGLAGCALVSLTAVAGENSHRVDPGFRRSTMVEQMRMTMMPPRLSPIMMATAQSANHADFPSQAGLSSQIMPYIRKVDLKRQGGAPLQTGEALLFMRNPLFLPASPLDPAITLERAGRVLMAHIARFEGRSLGAGFGGGSGDARGATSPEALSRTRPDGSTPAVNRAITLASVTPAPVEPEVVAASAMRVPTFARLEAAPKAKPPQVASLTGPRYIDLVDKDALKRESKCLAEAVYFEARSESEEGQAAVAQVVLNRVKSGLYPATICGVVYQNRHMYKACQFSFACEGRSLAITEPQPWLIAQRIAKAVLEGQTYLPAVGQSTHYHANYVAPYWSRLLKKTDKIGQHIFYRLRPGQT
jgi:spore germination cell wall hydrolase CwlJ-like protein